MRWQRRGDFARDYRELAALRLFSDECKWVKTNSSRSRPFFEDLVDYFFRQPWLAFHCIVIRKETVRRELHNNDFDLARRKHFTMFLARKIQQCRRGHPGRDHEFRVWVDPIASRYAKADEAVGAVANNIINRELEGAHPIASVRTKDSKHVVAIQLCDLLLGAVMAAWQQDAVNKNKLAVQTRVAQYLGWSDLRADTYPDERKFNIWYFYDKSRGPREIPSRRVALRHPPASVAKPATEADLQCDARNVARLR